MKNLFTLAIAVTTFLTSCSELTIDSSSDEKLKASIEKVKASLPEDKRGEFEEAVGIVAFSTIDLSDVFSAAKADTGATERKMKESLNGKTAQDVIALSASIKAEREAEAIRIANEQKAKALQILELAEDLRKEGDYDRAMNRYNEAQIYDSENAEIAGRIAELERIIKEEAAKERDRTQKVNELLSRARELEKNDDLVKALNAYQQALTLDGDAEAAAEGIRETKAKIEDIKTKQDYLGQIELYDFEASTVDTIQEDGVPAVRFKLKNNGDRVLSEVKVTVYLKDRSGKVIAEEDFYPVIVSGFSLSGNNKPLKPGYIWEIERGKVYTIKDAPTEWEVGNASAKITEIEFEK